MLNNHVNKIYIYIYIFVRYIHPGPLSKTLQFENISQIYIYIYIYIHKLKNYRGRIDSL